MGENNIYRPYRTHIFWGYMMLGFSVVSLVIAGMLLRDSQSTEVFIILIVGCLGVILTYYFFASSKVMIVFGVDGLRILNDGRTKYCFVPWEKIPYGCCEKNYKGHRFWVLSASRINKEQAKKLANKGANSSKVYVEGAIVIYMDSVQDISRIEGLFEQKITFVQDECFKELF